MSSAKPRPRRDLDSALRVLLFIVLLPLLLAAILWSASAMSDSSRVPAEIAASARDSGVMMCAEGTIDHGEGSLVDRILSNGRFLCTAWRMRGRQTSSTTGAVDWPSSPRR